eukprot:scaffold208978_cov23-Tisochrysis_lutea.AAC.7
MVVASSREKGDKNKNEKESSVLGKEQEGVFEVSRDGLSHLSILKARNISCCKHCSGPEECVVSSVQGLILCSRRGGVCLLLCMMCLMYLMHGVSALMHDAPALMHYEFVCMMRLFA